MNMKKLSAAVIVMLGLGVSAAQAAGDGTLNFAGSVQSGSCSVDQGSTVLTVDFDGYSAATLNTVAAGTIDSAMQKDFKIKLSGCPEGLTTAQIKFDGRTSGYLPNVFIGNSTASYVGIIISDAETGAVITPKTFADNTKTIVAGDSNELNYKVALTKTSDSAAAAGSIDVPLTFTMSYQ